MHVYLHFQGEEIRFIAQRRQPIGIDQICDLNEVNEKKAILIIQVFPLQRTVFSSFARSSNFAQKYNFSIYFLKGNDRRQLNFDQMTEVQSIVKSNNLQTSCLLYNSNESFRKYKVWQQALPWIKPHYAIKSNPAIPLLNDFASQNLGFDCASRTELQAVVSLGTNTKDIIYSNPIKDQSDLEWAEKNGIKTTTADSIDELIKIKKYAPKMDILWRIAIKEEASDNLATAFSGKFGDDIDSQDKIHERMKQIQEMGINIKGIHFHCGSGQHGSSAFGRAVTLARECIRIGREYDHEMSLLDVGGGFPSGELNMKTIDALKVTQHDPLGYRTIAEPGRHFCGNSFYLLTRVLGKRLKNNKPCYHLNESLYHSFNCNVMDGVSFENSVDQFYSSMNESGRQMNDFESENSTLFGMTCDGVDIITKNINVPKELKVSDWLCVSGMGAYTYGCRSNFNGMKSTERVINWPIFIGEKQKEKRPALELAMI